MIKGKIWGNTELIFKNANFELHRINIKKGAKCSCHLHVYKNNIFYVENGVINIHVWKNDYDLIDTTTLKAGQKTNVKPNQYHQFECVEEATVLEIYYTESIGEDIVRKTVGINKK